jgi:protein TonB
MNADHTESRRGARKGFRHTTLLVMLAGAFAIPALADDEPMKVNRADAMAAATSKPTPAYPAIAKQLKVEGSVEVQVLIGEEGKVEDATAVSGNPILTKSAIETVKQWKFTPFKAGGKTVKAQAVLSFNFKM